jgi:hypothetical protein
MPTKPGRRDRLFARGECYRRSRCCRSMSPRIHIGALLAWPLYLMNYIEACQHCRGIAFIIIGLSLVKRPVGYS